MLTPAMGLATRMLYPNYPIPDQLVPAMLLANILAYYYEAWRKGFEKAHLSYPMEREAEISTESPMDSSVVDPEKLVEEFIKEIKEEGKKAFETLYC